MNLRAHAHTHSPPFSLSCSRSPHMLRKWILFYLSVVVVSIRMSRISIFMSVMDFRFVSLLFVIVYLGGLLLKRWMIYYFLLNHLANWLFHSRLLYLLQGCSSQQSDHRESTNHLLLLTLGFWRVSRGPQSNCGLQVGHRRLIIVDYCNVYVLAC